MRISEKILLYKIQAQKDPEAFGKLYDEYVEKIYRFIFFKVSNREEAEDLTSEVFLKTWNYLIKPSQNKVKSFSGLVYKVARNALIDYYRSKSKQQECSLEDAPEMVDLNNQYKEIENKEEVKYLLEIIKKMKEGYQEIVLLHYIEELSIAEIAKITEKSRTNVRVTLHRALKLLNKLIEEDKKMVLGIGRNEDKNMYELRTPTNIRKVK